MRQIILKRNQNIFCFLGPTRIEVGPTYSHSKWEIRVT